MLDEPVTLDGNPAPKNWPTRCSPAVTSPRLIAVMTWVVIVSACATQPTTTTTSDTPTTTITATTTTTAATTTTAKRSVWCNNRDAGLWPQHEPTPYDPAPLNADKAAIVKRLSLSLDRNIGQTNTAFDNMAEIHADDPAILTEVEQARQSTIRQIRALHRDAVAELESRFAREHREARADHDTRERERAELAALELRNEMMRYEIECQ